MKVCVWPLALGEHAPGRISLLQMQPVEPTHARAHARMRNQNIHA
jgi:hypothetical protein